MPQWSGLQRLQEKSSKQPVQAKKIMYDVAMRKALAEQNTVVQSKVVEIMGGELTEELKLLEKEYTGLKYLNTLREKYINEEAKLANNMREAETQLIKYYNYEPYKITDQGHPNKGKWAVKRLASTQAYAKRAVKGEKVYGQVPGSELYEQVLGDDEQKEYYVKQRKFWLRRIEGLRDQIQGKQKNDKSWEIEPISMKIAKVDMKIAKKMQAKGVQSAKAMEVYEDLDQERNLLYQRLGYNNPKTRMINAVKPETGTDIPLPDIDPQNVAPVPPEEGQEMDTEILTPEQIRSNKTIQFKDKYFQLGPGTQVPVINGQRMPMKAGNPIDIGTNQQSWAQGQIKDRLSNSGRNFLQNPGGVNLKRNFKNLSNEEFGKLLLSKIA